MSTRLSLSERQASEVASGRFVRVSLAGLAGFGGREGTSVLVGRVDGAWRAYENVCRHRALPLDLGAASPMSEDGCHLLCHQHGALYRTVDGLCVAGPCAGESLRSIEIRQDGDELVIGPASSSRWRTRRPVP
jgi:nitrite reductase/ring-hydroxylating ferredoxin subunit